MSQVTTAGVDAALRTWNLSTAVGQPVDFVLEELINAMAPVGASLEEEVARVAMSKTLDQLFEDAIAAGGLHTLDSLSAKAAVDVLELYLAHYINTRLMLALSIRTEMRSPSAQHAAAIEDDIKDYVRETVAIDLGAINLTPAAVLDIDWAGRDGRAFIDRIFVDALRLIEEAA